MVDKDSVAAKYAAKYYFYDLDSDIRLEIFSNTNQIINYYEKKYDNLIVKKTSLLIPFSLFMVNYIDDNNSLIIINYYSFFDLNDGSTKDSFRRSVCILKNSDLNNYTFYEKQFAILWDNKSENLIIDREKKRLTEINEKVFYDDIAKLILNYMRKIKVGDELYYGWWRFPGNEHLMGAWSTADGICCMVYTNYKGYDYICKRSNILESLWKCRNKNNGYCSDNQRFESLEATCIVAKAFWLEREYVRAEEIFADLINLWNQYGDSDYVGGIPLTILCLMLETLVLFGKEPELMKYFEKLILSRAKLTEKTNHIKYWAIKNDESSGCLSDTVKAVTALMALAEDRGEKTEMQNKLKYCGEWIYQEDWIDSEEEIIRIRNLDGLLVNDSISYSHYAIPECIMALLKLGFNKFDSKITDGIEEMLEHKSTGLWSFPRGSKNIQMWATHEVLQCICLYKTI